MVDWILNSWSDVWVSAVSSILIFISIIVVSKLAGLRTFAKMSNVDFAATIAIGSIIASVIMNSDQSWIKGSVAIASIISLQLISSYLKRNSKVYEQLTSNQPVELLRDGEVSYDHLKETGVSYSDLMAKLREANAFNISNVYSVVLETTGDISVLHSNDDDIMLSQDVMTGVKRINQ